MTEPKRVKSNEARRDWAELLQFVRTGGTVIVEHYNREIAAIVPLDRIKETTVSKTYTASIGLVSSVVVDDHCDVAVAENDIVGYRDDEEGNEVPQLAMSSNIMFGPVQLSVRTDEDVAAKVYDAADDVLTANGWRRTGDWDDAAGDAAYAPVERA